MATKKVTTTASTKRSFVKREAIDFGFETSKSNILFFISLIAVILVVFSALQILGGVVEKQGNELVNFLFSLFNWIVNSVISMGILKIALNFVDKKKSTLSDLIYAKPILSFLGVSIIKNIIIVIGLVLFIIPGVIFAIKLQFAEYLVVDKGLNITDALNKSWQMTKGVKWNLFLLSILLGLINLLGLLALVVGLIITVPLTWVASAYVYRKLLAQS